MCLGVGEYERARVSGRLGYNGGGEEEKEKKREERRPLDVLETDLVERDPHAIADPGLVALDHLQSRRGEPCPHQFMPPTHTHTQRRPLSTTGLVRPTGDRLGWGQRTGNEHDGHVRGVALLGHLLAQLLGDALLGQRRAAHHPPGVLNEVSLEVFEEDRSVAHEVARSYVTRAR